MSATPPFWLGRQPILDRAGNTVAYELLFRAGGAGTGGVTDNRMATASVIAHAFNELGIAEVLGDCRGFINFDAELLMSDVVELLPPERTVIELLETVQITPQVVARCRELRSRGFTLALDDLVEIDDAHLPILPLVSILKVDVLATPDTALPGLLARLRAAQPVQLLAEKVDSHPQSERCRELGFDLFQGYFFARPALLQGRRADPSRQVLVQLLQHALTEAENDAVELTFKQSPELSYKLMRLVNSVGMGMRKSIQSLSHALVILGRRQLQRWIQVLLFAHHSTGDFPSPLLNLAAARGKLMELMAERRSADGGYRDRAFMAGILSLLDTLLEVPMARAIEPLSLPDDVRAALLDRSGPLGHMLKVAEALERADVAAVEALLADGKPCGATEVPQLQVAALAWANAIGKPLREA